VNQIFAIITMNVAQIPYLHVTIQWLDITVMGILVLLHLIVLINIVIIVKYVVQLHYLRNAITIQ
jgi:hypothetical protein